MNFVRAIYYPFHGDKWFKRLLIGAVISIIPVANLMIEGYANEVTRRVARGDDGTSPPWNKIPRYFVEGTSQWIARVLHFGLLLGIGLLIRIPLVGAVVNRFEGPLFAALRASMPALIAMSCVTLFILIVAVWLGFYLLASDIRYSTGESRFIQLFEVKKNIAYFSAYRGKIMFAWFSSTVLWALLTLISLALGAILIPVVRETFAVIFFLINGFMLRMFTAHIHGQVAQQTMLEAPAGGVIQAY